MKNLFIYLCISTFAINLISCSEDVQESPIVGEPIEISINASTGTFTRAVYTEGDDDYTFSWSYNDALSVSNSTTLSNWSEFTTSSTTNSSSATFTGTIDSWNGTTDLYAIYNPNKFYGASINASDSTVTCNFVDQDHDLYNTTTTSSTTDIKNMGLLVGAAKDATTTNIPNVTLNQAMSFLGSSDKVRGCPHPTITSL